MSKTLKLTPVVRAVGLLWFFAGLIMLASQVANAQEVLYRVNTGGGQVGAIDGGAPWLEDTNANKSIYLDAVYAAQAGSELKNSNQPTNTLDASVPALTTPVTLFLTERWDPASGEPMSYRFPAVPGSNYEVRLFLADGFSGTDLPGERVFNIDVEGTAFTGVDLVDLFGNQVGGMLSATVVAAADGIIDVNFTHGAADNPTVNGIEVLCTPSCPVEISLDTIGDQQAIADQTTDIALSASDVDGTSNFSISSSTPDISGFASIVGQDGAGNATLSLSPSVLDKGSYEVTVTVDDDSASAEQTFTLSVLEDTGETLLRVNVGGPELVAADFTAPNWSADNPTPVAGGTELFSTGDLITAGEALPSSVPLGIFATERNDTEAAPEMKYELAVAAGTVVEVRLYFAEIFNGITAAGQRVFDVNVEGTVIADIDAYAAAGADAGIMRSAQVAVSADGILDIAFIQDVQRTALKGIEVVLGTRTQSDALFRVNAGGPTVVPLDFSLPDWSADANPTPSQYLIAGGPNNFDTSSGSAYKPIVGGDPSIPADMPLAIFDTERWDPAAAPEMLWQFTVDAGETYEVRLAFAELFNGITAAGQRLIDVAVEGAVRPELKAIDPFDRAGPAGAFVVTTLVTVHDGTLDVEFLHNVENPAIKGIEILPAPGNTDTDLDSVPDVLDNCTERDNATQADTDGDGFGNACDADFNNSGFVNYGDLAIFRSRFGTEDPDTDLNDDGMTNFADLAIFKSLFGQPPGPSGEEIGVEF